jgi:predicted dehydrogenase
VVENSVIRLAVVGCGRWGPNHVRNFNGFLDSKVVACVDTDKAQLKRMREVFPSVAASSDLNVVLRDPSIHAVVIATPTNTHYSVVRQALKAGKHVLCEKPLCERGSQADELSLLARKTGRVLMVGHVFLFNAGVIKLKELIDGNQLGDLHYLSATRTNLGPIRSDVNVIYDLATHDVAIFNWLLGRRAPEWVSATGASFLQSGIEDVAFASMKYSGGVYASIHVSWLNPKKVRQTVVVGSKKMVSWNDQELNTPIAIYDKGATVDHAVTDYGEFLRLSMWDGDVRLPKIQLEEPLKVQDRHFIQAIHRGVLDKSDGEFSVGVVRTIAAISRSIKQNGKPVRL